MGTHICLRDGISKHKAVFNEWLDGAEVEYKNSRTNGKWQNSGASVEWNIDSEYRVKPKALSLEDALRLLKYDTSHTVIKTIFERGIKL